MKNSNREEGFKFSHQLTDSDRDKLWNNCLNTVKQRLSNRDYSQG
jgi:hypothetical protein